MENRMPAATTAADAEPAPNLRRRFLIGGTAAVVGVAGSVHAAVPLSEVEREVPADATKIPGYPLAETSYGSRSQFETEVRTRFKTATPLSSWTLTPLQNSIGIITPSGLHFERSHGGTAVIDPAKHMLYVHGTVKQPRKFTMADIRRFPSLSRTMFIECSGNGLTEWSKPTMKTVQGTHGLTSCSEWTGVPLATILREAGLRTDAKWLLAEGGDASVMTRSIPMAKALKDCLVAYGQNGEALRPEQGYPLRLIVPGYEGNTHIKWLRRIEVSDTPFMTREETSKYTDLMPNGKAVQFSFEMDAKSVITAPSGEMQLDGPGFYEIAGLAWSGRGSIKKVEVSTDGGATWKTAALQGPILPICHTRFRLPWRWDGKAAIVHRRHGLRATHARTADRCTRWCAQWSDRLHLSPECHSELASRKRRKGFQCPPLLNTGFVLLPFVCSAVRALRQVTTPLANSASVARRPLRI